MEIKEILDKLDSKIFPEEVKTQMVESFTQAVSEAVAKRTTELETEYIDKEIAMERKYTGKIEKFFESEREHIANYLEEEKKALTESLITKYADEVIVEDALSMYRRVQNFLGEASAKLNVSPKQIDESEKSSSAIIKLESELTTAKEKYNGLAKFSLIKEHYDQIEVPRIQEQFEKLAGEIDFDGDVKTFNRKLERLRESLVGEYKNIVESVKKDVVVESKKNPVKPTEKKPDRLAFLKESIRNKRAVKQDLVIESEPEVTDDFDVSIYN